jgi:hypothetical protein
LAGWIAVGALALALVPAPGLAHANPKLAKAGTVTLHPAFREIPGGFIQSSENDVVVYGGVYGPGDSLLINDATASRTPISTPGCDPQSMGGPWLVELCSSYDGLTISNAYGLIDLANPTSGLTRDPSIGTGPGCGPDAGCTPVAVGKDWIAQSELCDEHCVPAFNYLDIATGQAQDDPTGRRTITNLSFPTLTVSTCADTTVPTVNIAPEDGYSRGWGSVTYVGKYAIEVDRAGVYLQRCGSKARTLLTDITPNEDKCAHAVCPPAANETEIVWQQAPGELQGIFLSNLKRFTIPIPQRVDPSEKYDPALTDGPYTVALTRKTLYLAVDNTTAHVWTTPLPEP